MFSVRLPESAPVRRRRLGAVAGLGFAGAVLAVLGALRCGSRPVGATWPGTAFGFPDLPWLGSLGPFLAFYVGVAVLLGAWLGLVRLARAGGLGHRPVRTVCAVGALWVVPFLLGPPIGSRDAYSYLAQGELASQGLDPYTTGPSALDAGPIEASVDPLWVDTPAPYGPIGVASSQVVASLPGAPPVPQVLAYRALVVAALVVLVACTVLLVRSEAAAEAVRGSPATQAAAVALVAANPVVLVHGVAGAHNDALMGALLAAGCCLALRRRWALGVMVAAAGAAVKIPAVLGVAVLGRWRPGRRAGPAELVGAAALGAGVLVASGFLTGHGLGWIGALGTPGSALSYLSFPTGVGILAGWLVAGVAPVSVETVIAVARGLGVAASGVVCLALYRRAHERPLECLGWGLLSFAVLGPAVQPWYLLWCLPFLAAVMTARTRSYVLAWCALVSLAVPPSGTGIVEAVRVEGWAPLAAVAAVALAVLAVVTPRPLLVRAASDEVAAVA